MNSRLTHIRYKIVSNFPRRCKLKLRAIAAAVGIRMKVGCLNGAAVPKLKDDVCDNCHKHAPILT